MRTLQDLVSILNEYDNLLVVTDLEIKVQGATLTHIFYDIKSEKVRFFTGDIVEDDHAEELFPTESELQVIYNELEKNF